MLHTARAKALRCARFEHLERREMLSAGGWDDWDRTAMAKGAVGPITWSDPIRIPFEFQVEAQLAKDYPLMAGNLDAAGKILSSLLGGSGKIEVAVKTSTNMPFPTAAADSTSVPGTIRDASGKTVNVEVPATLSEANTGVDPNGGAPDIIINIHPDYLKNTLWFDPSGSLRSTPVPAGKADFISTVLHEIVHGLGMAGLRYKGGSQHGQFINGQRSSFDALTDWSPDVFGLVVFNGPEASSLYGGPVPLTSYAAGHANVAANFYHLGDQFNGQDLLDDLMSGIPSKYGTRHDVSQTDLAILHDLGWHGPQRVPIPSTVQFQRPQLYVDPPIGPLPPIGVRGVLPPLGGFRPVLPPTGPLGGMYDVRGVIDPLPADAAYDVLPLASRHTNMPISDARQAVTALWQSAYVAAWEDTVGRAIQPTRWDIQRDALESRLVDVRVAGRFEGPSHLTARDHFFATF